MRSVTRFVPILLSVVFLFPTGARSDELSVPPEVLAGIKGNDAMTHIRFLASDELLGRHSADPSIHVAARYLATRFEACGLLPIFQPFGLEQVFLPEDSGLEITLPSGKTDVFRADGVTCIPFPFSTAGSVEGELVFVGYGITNPDLAYDDYAGVNVRGRIAVMLRYEPQEVDPKSPWNGKRHTRHAFFQSKVKNAVDHGAVGLLLVTGPLHHEEDGFISAFPAVRGLFEDGEEAPEAPESRSIPAFHISQDTARAIFSSADRDLREVQEGIDSANEPGSFSLGLSARLDARFESRRVETRNVVAILPGSDPSVVDEVVVIGAHYDHVGTNDDPEDPIHNGADDNASGTAALLEIADAFASLPTPPRRSILFIAFSGEELGLLGSIHYVRHPLVPLAKTVAMYNLDMVGRNPKDPLYVTGTSNSQGLERAVNAAARRVGTAVEHARELSGGSDHVPFIRAGIPSVHFFSGFHEDYHQVTDHADKISAERVESAARVAFLASFDTANARERPTLERRQKPRREF